MTSRSAHSTRGRLVVGLIVLTVSAAGLTGVATSAIFIDSVAVTTGTFTAGTVSLTTNPATTLLSTGLMAPGDMMTAPITITNSGTLAMRYAVTSAITAGDTTLAAQLKLTIKSGLNTGNCAAWVGGTEVYTGVLGTSGGTKLIGDSATGPNAGDRTLAAAGFEVLCARVMLPTDTGNNYQTKTTTATLTFNAEQTLNNP